MVWPSARARRAICGCAITLRPKEEGRVHAFQLEGVKIFGVVPGHGPSSKSTPSSWTVRQRFRKLRPPLAWSSRRPQSPALSSAAGLSSKGTRPSQEQRPVSVREGMRASWVYSNAGRTAGQAHCDEHTYPLIIARSLRSGVQASRFHKPSAVIDMPRSGTNKRHRDRRNCRAIRTAPFARPS